MERNFSKDEYTIYDIIKIDTKRNIRRGFKRWGIEKTEEKIKQHYGNNPKAFDFMMECYREIINGESDI